METVQHTEIPAVPGKTNSPAVAGLLVMALVVRE
jgi:hypothetical protein